MQSSGCAECAVQAVSATSAVTPRSPTPPLASGQSFLFPTLGKQIIQSLREKHMWRIISISFLFKTAMNPSSQTNKEGFNVSDSASGCRLNVVPLPSSSLEEAFEAFSLLVGA